MRLFIYFSKILSEQFDRAIRPNVSSDPCGVKLSAGKMIKKLTLNSRRRRIKHNNKSRYHVTSLLTVLWIPRLRSRGEVGTRTLHCLEARELRRGSLSKGSPSHGAKFTAVSRGFLSITRGMSGPSILSRVVVVVVVTAPAFKTAPRDRKSLFASHI